MQISNGGEKEQQKRKSTYFQSPKNELNGKFWLIFLHRKWQQTQPSAFFFAQIQWRTIQMNLVSDIGKMRTLLLINTKCLIEIYDHCKQFRNKSMYEMDFGTYGNDLYFHSSFTSKTMAHSIQFYFHLICSINDGMIRFVYLLWAYRWLCLPNKLRKVREKNEKNLVIFYTPNYGLINLFSLSSFQSTNLFVGF